MGNMELTEEQLRRLKENIVPVSARPTEPATPTNTQYSGATIVAQAGNVRIWDWQEVLQGATTEQLAEALLRHFGVHTDEEHMKNTPARYVRMMKELTQGEPFNFTTFETDCDEMIALSPIPFYTLCAHHVIPFYGQAHIGYVPDGWLAGLSKFARLVKNIAKGLWVQEELTAAIANALDLKLKPKGVAVILEGEHMCMSMRGVQTPGVITRTAAMKGVFADHTRTAKAEFLEAVRDHR
jgi:GTP cyclohydrolase IA